MLPKKPNKTKLQIITLLFMSILLLTSNSYADCGGVKFLNFELDSNREKININIQIIDSKKEIKLIFIVFLKNGESFQIVDPRLRSKTKKGKESDQIKWKFSDSKVLSKDDEKKIKNSGPSSVIKEIKVCNKKYWDTISLMDPIWPARAFKKYDRKGSIHPTALLAGAGILAAPIVGAYLRFKVAPDSYKTYQEERCNG